MPASSVTVTSNGKIGRVTQRGHGKGGRKSKGDRRLIATRIDASVAVEVAAAAAERGMTVSDYLADLVYRDLAKPCPNPNQQLRLTA